MTYHYSNITVESSVNEKRVDVSGSVHGIRSKRSWYSAQISLPFGKKNIQPLILRSSMSGRLMEGFSLIH